jgi:hypothetical protein
MQAIDVVPHLTDDVMKQINEAVMPVSDLA